MKTNTEITATANNRSKIFTLRVFENGKLKEKYKTERLTNEEFEKNLKNNSLEWNEFLMNNDTIQIK